MTPEQRRAAFITDIVEVCKRHRVLVYADTENRYVAFEQYANGQPAETLTDIWDIESAVQKAVWPIVQGEGK